MGPEDCSACWAAGVPDKGLSHAPNHAHCKLRPLSSPDLDGIDHCQPESVADTSRQHNPLTQQTQSAATVDRCDIVMLEEGC